MAGPTPGAGGTSCAIQVCLLLLIPICVVGIAILLTTPTP